MGKKHFRAIEKELEGLGYSYSHTNSKSAFVYTHPTHESVAVNPGLPDGPAKILMSKIRRLHGTGPEKAHRSGAAAKERQAKERARLVAQDERLVAERERLLAERSRRRMAGLAEGVAADDFRALCERIEQIERERHQIERLMSAPTSARDAGDARVAHRSGGAA